MRRYLLFLLCCLALVCAALGAQGQPGNGAPTGTITGGGTYTFGSPVLIGATVGDPEGDLVMYTMTIEPGSPDPYFGGIWIAADNLTPPVGGEEVPIVEGQVDVSSYISGPGEYAIELWAWDIYHSSTDSQVATASVFVTPSTPPEVLLEVHPNERAPGASTAQYLGKEPWTQPSTTPAATYWWQMHEFAAHGPLWIQLCAQNWDSAQKGYAGNDRTKLVVNGLTPTDYDLMQTGAPGSWQWLGKNEKGKRVTLRFLTPTTPGKQALWIGAAESPVLWWLKVTDLEPDVIEPIG